MENDIEDQRHSGLVETVKQNLQENQTMAPQKKSKFNRPLFIAFFLVVIILAVYILSSRPNKDLTERMHHDWVKTMTKESNFNNDSVGLRHFERHEETQSNEQTGLEQARVSMVLPAEVPEDLHKAQTEGMPLQQGSGQIIDLASKNTTGQSSGDSPRKLIDMKLYSDGNKIESNAESIYAYDKEGNKENVQQVDEYDEEYEDDDVDDYDDDNELYKHLRQKGQYEYKNRTGISEQNTSSVITSINGSNINNYTSNDTMNIESQYNRENVVQKNLVDMHIEPANYIEQPAEQVNNVSSEQNRVNYGNLEQVNNIRPEFDQVNYPKPDQGQVNYVNSEQANYKNEGLGQANFVRPEQGQINYVNPEVRNYANPQNQQADYVKLEHVQINYVDNGQNIYEKPILEQANFVKPELNQANYAQPEQVPMNQDKSNYAQSELGQANYAKEQQGFVQPQQEFQGFVQPQQEIQQVNYGEQEKPSFNKPVDSLVNIPSYNGAINNNQQYPGLGNNIVGGTDDTRAKFQNGYGENGHFLDTNKLSQTYQNGYDNNERKIGKQLFNIDSVEKPSTKTPYTLSETIESRMKLHKVLKDMHDIVDYGSAKSDKENTKPWNEDENREHLYDKNHKVNLFDNLRMQINLQAEPVTGTKPMRPPYKSSIQYPEYLTPINWETSFQHVQSPTFECVPMRTIDKYIRICIHPPSVRSSVSSKLKAEATWEYSALMDMQKALLQNKDAFLIDIGASFGVFSLAAAALNRHVIAVEPYSSHIQVLMQSVALNSFKNHITLFQAVISDRRGKVLIKPLGDHVDNVYIQTVEDDEKSTNFTLVVNTVTLDDIEKICPGRVAVLKIDIPGFEKRALEYSYFFFKYIYVTHVFMHWDTSDKALCLFVTRFFVERGYQPYSDLNGSAKLDIQYAGSWTNDIVIWKL